MVATTTTRHHTLVTTNINARKQKVRPSFTSLALLAPLTQRLLFAFSHLAAHCAPFATLTSLVRSCDTPREHLPLTVALLDGCTTKSNKHAFAHFVRSIMLIASKEQEPCLHSLRSFSHGSCSRRAIIGGRRPPMYPLPVSR